MATCYVLTMQVEPGGARESSHWMCNSWDEVKQIMLDDLSGSMGAYLTAWYGRMMALRLFENGKVTTAYNPKDWIHFRKIGKFENPEFQSDEYGPLSIHDELDTRKMFGRNAGTTEGNTIRHPYYTIELEFPADMKLLEGNAKEGTVCELPDGTVDFPYSNWE